MNKILLLFVFFVSACTLQHAPPPSVLGPEIGVAVAPPPSATEATQQLVEARTYRHKYEAERLLYVSSTGSDKTPCADISAVLPAKTIKRAIHCMQPCEAVIIQTGEYHESVTINKDGESGCPLEILGEGTVFWFGTKEQKALSVLGSFVHIRGIIFDHVLFGPNKGWSQGLVLARSAVQGTTIIRNLGTPEKDPGIAASIIEYSAFKGPVDVQGHDMVLRGNLFNRAKLSGGRHLVKYNTFKERMLWQGAESHAEENDFEHEVVISSAADNTLFGAGNVFHRTVTLGTTGIKDQVVGVTFHRCLFRGAIFNALNARSTIFMNNDSDMTPGQ